MKPDFAVTAALIKTLDSGSVRNIVASLPYSSTVRNDGAVSAGRIRQ